MLTFNSVGNNNYYFVYSSAFKIFWKTEESLRLHNIFVCIDHFKLDPDQKYVNPPLLLLSLLIVSPTPEHAIFGKW